jgi:hypothetical protein
VGDLDEYGVALRVAAALEAIGVEYTLGGSLAGSLHGEPRSTNDIDFAVRLEPQQVPALVDRLGPDFVVDQERLLEAVRLGRTYQLYFLPFVLKIDLFMRGTAPFDRSEFARRVRIPIGESEGLYAATAEDSLLRKLVWFREGGGVSDRQWRDVLGILRISGPTLDREYLERWARQLGVSDLWQRALAQAEGPDPGGGSRE